MRKTSGASLLLLISATASAANQRCAAPPFGDTQEKYQAIQAAFSREETASPDLPPGILVRSLQTALIEACKAKFENGDRASYYANGIPDREIDALSTTELANAWFTARNAALAPEMTRPPPSEEESRVYAIFQCIAATGSCYRAVTYTFDTSRQCRDYARSMTHVSPTADGRFPVSPSQWFECRSKQVETWKPAQ